MRVTVPHHTTRAKAREIVERKISVLLAQFGEHAGDVRHDWTGDTFQFKGTARGFTVEGTVEITDAEVVIDGKLPMLARPFEPRIQQAVEREAETMFRTA